MIEQVSKALRELGVDSARVHAEHFTVSTAGESAAAGARRRCAAERHTDRRTARCGARGAAARKAPPTPRR